MTKLNMEYYFQIVTRSMKPEDIELQSPCIQIFHKDTFDKENRSHYDVESPLFAEDTNTVFELLRNQFGPFIMKELQSGWYDNNDKSTTEQHIVELKKYMSSLNMIENPQRFHNKNDIFKGHRQYCTLRKASFCNKDFQEDITTNGGEQQLSLIQIPKSLFDIYVKNSPENFNVLQLENWSCWDYDAMTLLMQDLQTLQLGTIMMQNNHSIFPLHYHVSKNSNFDFEVDKIIDNNKEKFEDILKTVCIYKTGDKNEALESLADFYQSLVDLDDIIKE